MAHRYVDDESDPCADRVRQAQMAGYDNGVRHARDRGLKTYTLAELRAEVTRREELERRLHDIDTADLEAEITRRKLLS